ncbi:cell wall metabolism sensor histidine kinase WalK [Dolosigranulum pigrum]|jgi:histidine protein kinase; sensor protein|uniref:histidine kinase n=1 Tax=Dolosigranulum pigrum TaxID=29394 RepID=A0A328KMQ3_9LACT|nr:cell wall metabolism sensor histidine kinase WalK [Dolosigranulum pigrum]QJS95704.1 cell wall metabolism sensor histidine kinase WalK [Dolosigranulum pigrum]QTJ32088.1 cell wall metabolism sensor histidine kinase WalK [Dolosigranulum pigrum]QTJ40648.1 cell wall metabolism sensor histidine kinase WalK [Dolosigranulum pigrum]QTJ42427.1 cell wall metabolism sensor histidine kinase WalK [Dolosigranulum pigrum]QTJ45820.1 cell wall metabolism sensor histidine kinase WalK [Dolosigranulum pigrum]
MKDSIRFYKSINTKLIFVIVMLIVFVLQFIGANFITQIEQELVTSFQQARQQEIAYLKNTSRQYLEQINNPDNEGENNAAEEINNLVTDFSSNSITDIKIYSPQFIILGISDNTLQRMVGQITNDNDVRHAYLQGQQVTRQIIDSQTEDRQYKIVEPVYAGDNDSTIVGLISLESNIESVYNQVDDISLVFIRSSIVAIIASLILAHLISRAITKPIKEMQTQTKQIADGDYSGSLVVHGEDELGQLAKLINDLSDDVSEAQEWIESERRRLHSVLTHMTDGVVATDRRGLITTINDMAQSMLNCTQEDVLGKKLTTVLDLEDNFRMREIITQERDIAVEESALGESLILRASFSVIQRESGFISGYVCVLHDITEQKRIDEERKQFVSNVSHELRTPLTSLRSYIEALSDGAWKDPELAPRFLEVTQGETDRMIRMVQDLLHLSRIDSGKSDLELEIIDVKELFEHVLRRFDMLVNSNEYDQKIYSIKSQIMIDSQFIEADSDRFIQVLDNLLNNAIKYSPDGGIITGKLRLNGQGDRVILSIADEGMGIPKSDLQKVFSRFYRVDRARSRAMGGSGLGLAISKEVIEQHGGKIWARSVEQVGTTFYISMPIVTFDGEDEWA